MKDVMLLNVSFCCLFILIKLKVVHSKKLSSQYMSSLIVHKHYASVPCSVDVFGLSTSYLFIKQLEVEVSSHDTITLHEHMSKKCTIK